ncbi:MAG: hypothetical protein U1F35_18685 [Steroidobacteraceae bacterium]
MGLPARHAVPWAVGSEINAPVRAAFADIPEGDSNNDIHGWRAMAAGATWKAVDTLVEAGTFVQAAPMLRRRDLLYMLQRADMAGGINRWCCTASVMPAPGARAGGLLGLRA